MKSTLYQILLFATLSSCHFRENVLPDKNLTNPQEIVFVNRLDSSITILTDDHNIFSLSVCNGQTETFIGVDFGFFRRHTDTIFVRNPELHSDEWNKIKTKYYLVELLPGKTFNGQKYVPDTFYQQRFPIQPYVLIDSLLQISLSDSAAIVQVDTPLDTLIITDNKIQSIKRTR